MLKRQRRRQDEKRVKAKFVRVAKRWAGDPGSWINKLKVTWSGLGTGNVVIHRQKLVDRRGAVERMRFIERTANRLAHHNKCPCQMCKGERYNRRKDLPPIEMEE